MERARSGEDGLEVRWGPGRAALGAALCLAGLLAPGAAAAHEVHHAVERSRAVAVRAWEGADQPIADASFQVFSPAEPTRPFLQGRTDRAGYLAFVPDAPGKWKVRVVEDDGHGFETEVEVGAVAPTPASATGAAGAAGAATILGAAVVGVAFAGLVLFYRRRGRLR